MTMLVVQIRPMWVGVGQRLVPMRMGMWLTGWVIWSMLVLVMRVMDVAVRMFQFIMYVLVNMALGKMKPLADSHQKTRNQERSRHRRAGNEGRDNGTYKGCSPVIGSSPRGSQVPERDDEQNQTQPVADKAEQQRA